MWTQRSTRSRTSRTVASLAAMSALGVAALVGSGHAPGLSRSGEGAVTLGEVAGLRAEVSPDGVALSPAHSQRTYTISAAPLVCDGDLRALPRARFYFITNRCLSG